MKKEIWKDIPGYEGKYQVCTKDNGTVRSMNYNGKRGNIKELSKFLSGGYWKVHIHDRPNNIDIHPGIHILLAKAFIPNPDNLSDVHHIDGNKLNNNLDNLVWMSRSKHMKHHKEKMVGCYDLSGNLIKIYNRILDTELDGFKHSLVSAVCLGKRNKHHDHYFKFVD